MASSHGQGSFSAGPSSTSSQSVDSDNDTDLDSEEAALHTYLPSLHQQPLQHSLPKYSHPERSTSLPPKAQYDYGDVRLDPSQQYSLLSGEEKQYFDHFWTDFHQKRQQRRAQARGANIATERSVEDIMNGRHYSESNYNARAYEYPRQRQPLINLIHNKWQTDPQYKSQPGWSNDDIGPPSPTFNQFLAARRPRRWLVILITSILFLYVYWRRHGAEAWHEHQLLSSAVEHRLQSDRGYFGANMLPEFAGMTQVKKLDSGAILRSKDKARLIVIGDVHGCHEELQALLTKLDFKVDSDHVIFSGDLISKGPSSPAAVDLAIASRASCVRGNHEDRALLAYRDLQIHHSLPPQPIDPSEGKGTAKPPRPGNPNRVKEATSSKVDETTDSESFLSGDHKDQVLAKTLSKEQIKYLSSCPVILELGPVAGLGDVRVVHAGLVPGVSMQRQDPISVMQMRTLDLETHVPSHVNDGTPWTKIWNKYQSFLKKKERSTVIYGHDSKRGLQLDTYTKGIDTGCVKGGKLTALILTGGNNKHPKTVSVNCKDYRPKRPPSGEELGQS